jgi:hypothetical protein
MLTPPLLPYLPRKKLLCNGSRSRVTSCAYSPLLSEPLAYPAFRLRETLVLLAAFIWRDSNLDPDAYSKR